MKPLGRKPTRFPGKIDWHVKKDKLVNWWEDMIGCKKKSERQKSKKELKKYIHIIG